tara:strand:- start:774 stop:965 length:192 start_codon:yes stop_codon:yes gene_type:complete
MEAKILLTTEDVAEKLACSIWTVRRMVDDQHLKAIRIGRRCLRFDPADVDEYIQSNKNFNQGG